MKRHELEHILRASGAITGLSSFYIIGSQAILGYYPDAPDDLLVSQEVDTWPADDPEKAILIEGTIGEMSPFHETFGYYAHGVGPDTAILPRNWENRIIRIQNENTNGIAGLCLSPVDIAISKLCAGRPKDLSFVNTMIRYNLVSVQEVLTTVQNELIDPMLTLCRDRLQRLHPDL